jgi:hypothetical protein
MHMFTLAKQMCLYCSIVNSVQGGNDTLLGAGGVQPCFSHAII